MQEPNSQPDNSDNWPQVTEQDPRKLKELQAVYARLFKPGGDGFVVMGDLYARYLFSVQPHNANHDFFAGQSSVMKYIQSQIQQGQSQ